MKYTPTVILISLLCTILLSGCRNNSDIDNSGLGGTAGHLEYLYAAEIIPFPELPGDFWDIRNITVAGDTVYFTASVSRSADNETVESFKSDTIFTMSVEGTNLRMLPDYSTEKPPSAATGGGLYIDAMYMDGDGNLWVIETGRYYLTEEPDVIRDAGSSFTIRKLDSNGAGQLSADISGFAEDINSFYISMFIIDKDGYIYIGVVNIFNDITSIYVMDSDCNKLFNLDASVRHNRFILTSDGSVAFIRQQNNEGYIQKIDVTGKAWGDRIHLPENAYNVFSGNSEFSFLFTDTASLYGISIESGETRRILNWMDVGIVSMGLETISFLPDERIFLTKSTISPGSGEHKYELIFLSKTGLNSGVLADKTELTLGTLYMHPQLQEPIHQFNNKSTTHYISVIDYSSHTTPDDTEGALLRFTTEITAGKMPDILILTSLPFDRLIAMDLFMDLYPYLDSDPELSRESLMESVLKATEINGKLYLINQSFTISTIFGNPSVLGEYPGWNMEEFKAVIDANPQADIPFGPYYTKEDFLWTLLYMNLFEYIDMTTGTADFNKRDFIELLMFINTFPSERDESIYNDIYNREQKSERRQIMDTFIGGLSLYTIQKESFGGEIVFKGWPTADRNGHRFISHDSVAITTLAADKDGAWEFVRTLLMEEHQMEYFGNFPINRDAFEKKMQRDMAPMGFWHEGETIMVEPTQAEVDDIVELINSTTKVTGHGSDVMLRNIIIESASDFFNGLISAEDAARIIQSRVTIFLAEQG